MRRFVLSAIIFLSAATASMAAPAAEPPAGQSSAGAVRELAALKSEFRRYRRDPARRADTLWKFVKLGPAGVAAAKELISGELDQYAKAAAAPSRTDAFDEQIEQFRQILAELRNDPALSKEKLESVGIPALDGLNRIYAQRQPLYLRDRARLDRLAQDLERFAEFLQAAKAAGPPDGSSTLDAFLARTEELLAATRDPLYAEVQKIFRENAVVYAELDRGCVEGMQGLNKMRIMFGLHPLAADRKLYQAATGHATDMKTNKFFAHQSPLPGKTSFQDRAGLAGTTASGENIYMGRSSAYSAVKGWFLSPGHHKNMFSETHRRQGLGRADDYWTHLFGR